MDKLFGLLISWIVFVDLTKFRFLTDSFSLLYRT
jgi:hypothetical protein